MIRRVAVAVLLSLGMVAAPTLAHAGPAEDIHALVNQARWANGLAGLIRNPAMDQVAANWAAQLAQQGALSHNPDCASQIPGGWVAAGENVAQGYGSGAAMHDGWMSSSGHRANVLGDFTDIGIAFLSAGGTTWGVEVFAKYPGHAGPANPAPPPPAPAPEPEAPEPEAPEPETPADDGASETPAPQDSATPDAESAATVTPEPRTPRAVDGRGDHGSAPPWWPVIAGIVLVAGAATTTVLRRRRTTPGA